MLYSVQNPKLYIVLRAVRTLQVDPIDMCKESYLGLISNQ